MIIYSLKALSPSKMKTCVQQIVTELLWWGGIVVEDKDAQEFVLKELTVLQQAVSTHR